MWHQVRGDIDLHSHHCQFSEHDSLMMETENVSDCGIGV
jgi:hypothetical protein